MSVEGRQRYIGVSVEGLPSCHQTYRRLVALCAIKLQYLSQ